MHLYHMLVCFRDEQVRLIGIAITLDTHLLGDIGHLLC